MYTHTRAIAAVFVALLLKKTEAYFAASPAEGCDNNLYTGVVEVTGCDAAISTLNASTICGFYSFVGVSEEPYECGDGVPVLVNNASGLALWFTAQTSATGARFFIGERASKGRSQCDFQDGYVIAAPPNTPNGQSWATELVRTGGFTRWSVTGIGTGEQVLYSGPTLCNVTSSSAPLGGWSPPPPRPPPRPPRRIPPRKRIRT